MKKLILAALAVSTFAACSRDNNGNETIVNNLVGDFPVGAWKNTQNAYLNGKNLSEVLNSSDLSCSNQHMFKIFNDGNFERHRYTASCTETEVGEDIGTYTYNPTTKVITTRTVNKGTRVYWIRKSDASAMYVDTQGARTDVNGDGAEDIPVYVFVKAY